MTSGQVIILVVGGVVLLLGLSLVVMYDRFVRQRTLIDESWGEIDVELTRRHELIPNLVDSVQGYAEHDRDVLENLTRVREAATAHQQHAPKQREQFEESLGIAVATVMVRAEAYPDLKASANFLQLQGELTDPAARVAPVVEL